MAKWRKITPKSPTPDTMVLVCGGEWESDLAAPSRNDDTRLVITPRAGSKWPETGGEYYASWVNNPTHWQPCPEPIEN